MDRRPEHDRSRESRSPVRDEFWGPNCQKLEQFVHSHQEWLVDISRDEVAVALPAKMIAALAKYGGCKDRQIRDSEQELSSTCHACEGIGVHLLTRQAIHYVPIVDLGLKFGNAFSQELKRSLDPDTNIYESQPARHDQIACLKGYAGWLLTEKSFVHDRNDLRQLWSALTDHIRPPLPLRRSLKIPYKLPYGRPAHATFSDFHSKLDSFLAKWYLTELTIWELPLPQGELPPEAYFAGCSFLPEGTPGTATPFYYPISGRGPTIEKLRQQQADVARHRGLPESAVGLPHVEMYGNILELVFWEDVLRRRLKSLARRGAVGIILNVLADHLEVGLNHVRKLRKGISSCLRGQRHKVKWLAAR